MAGTLTVDTIQSDSSYASRINVTSNVAFTAPVNFTGGMQVGGQDTTFGGMRNKIINGSMQVAQRNTSAAGVVATGYYACDRMQYYRSGNALTVTISQAADGPAGFSSCHKVQTTTANTSVGTGDLVSNTYYTVENEDMQDLAWGTASAKPMTLSFWVKSNKIGTYSVSSYLNFSSSFYVFANTYSINTADTWEYKTIVIPGFTTTTIPNDNAGAFSIYWNTRCGTSLTSGTATTTWSTYTNTNWAVGHTAQWGTSTSDYISMTGIQLEKGSAATAFENRYYGQELALCQRYYQTYPGIGQGNKALWSSYGATYNYVIWSFKTTMRTSPTIAGATMGSVETPSPDAVTAYAAGSNYAAYGYNGSAYGQATATAEL